MQVSYVSAVIQKNAISLIPLLISAMAENSHVQAWRILSFSLPVSTVTDRETSLPVTLSSYSFSKCPKYHQKEIQLNGQKK